MQLPQSLREGVIAWEADGEDWADSLSALIEHCRQLWGLTVGEPFEGGHVSWVAPAVRADGSACVLKVAYPGIESRHEPDALELWDGHGAVRLLDREDGIRALLLERLQPGSSLLDLPDPDEALGIACEALLRLWVPPGKEHPFVTAQACALDWCETTIRRHAARPRPFDTALLNAAVAAFQHLATYDGDVVVLHQDFHRGNILRAQREPWLAIDPKPLAGERAFDARWLLYDLLYSDPRIRVTPAALVERVADELSVDAERVRLWTLARAVESVLWCYELGEEAPDDLALATALA